MPHSRSRSSHRRKAVGPARRRSARGIRRRGPLARLGLGTLALGAPAAAAWGAWTLWDVPSPGAALADQPTAASRSATPRLSSRPAPPSHSPSPSPSASRSSTPKPSPTPPDVPLAGFGAFQVAPLVAGTTGHGTLGLYRVDVEEGTGVDPADAARQVARILSDQRGWTRPGTHAFRQVTSSDAGLIVKIATPATADRLCAAGGLNTRGELNCRTGATVVVNLRRWQLGSPTFTGPVTEYRALIVNHEVGHWLGYGHAGCPGPGRPAPVMMQQIKGLDGCTSNAWPYAEDGTYLDGPAVP